MGTLSNIGGIYLQQENIPKAKEYFQRILEFSIKENNQERLASIQANMGHTHTKAGEYTQAMPYLEKAKLAFEALDEKVDLANVLTTVGMVLSYQGKNTEALVHINRALELRKEADDSFGLAYTLSQKGEIELRQANYSLAIQHCTKAFDLANGIGALVPQKDACQCLYDSYKGLGKGAEALVQLEMLNTINDQLQNEESAKKLQEMEFEKEVFADSLAHVEKARLVKVAHEKEVRKNNKTRNALIGAGLLALLLAAAFYSRWKYLRKSKDIIEKERDRSDNLLLNILPAEIAEELKAKGRADARDFEMASILFTDFKD